MQTKETTKHVSWAKELRLSFTRHWLEKILAVIIATLFWNMVKKEAARNNPSRTFIEEHSLGNAAGISPHPTP